MKIFTVVITDDFSKRLFLEHYPLLELALVRACQLAHHIYGINGNHDPQPQNCGDGATIEYVVYRSDEEDVFISVLESALLTALPHFRGKHIDTTIEQKVATIQNPILELKVDDPNEATLPAGWDYNDNPIRMEDFLADPNNVVPFEELTDHEGWALVSARISKRPNFIWRTDLGTYTQNAVLQELKNKTELGYDILNEELDYLEILRLKHIDIVNDE